MEPPLYIGSASYKTALHLRPRRTAVEKAKKSLLGGRWGPPSRPVTILWALLSAVTGSLSAFCLSQSAWFVYQIAQQHPAQHIAPHHLHPPMTGPFRGYRVDGATNANQNLHHLVHTRPETPAEQILAQINTGPLRFCKLFTTENHPSDPFSFSSVRGGADLYPPTRQECFTHVLPDDFPFSTNFWTKTCLLYGNGTLVLLMSTVVAFATLGYDLETAKKMARRTAKVQGIAVVLLLISLSILPFVLPPTPHSFNLADPLPTQTPQAQTFHDQLPNQIISPHFQPQYHLFHPTIKKRSPIYANQPHSYEIGWAYTLGVMSALLALFCPFLAHNATLLTGETHPRCPTGDAWGDALDVNGNFV